MDTSPSHDQSYALDDRYRLASGRVRLTGVQALVRLPLMQRQRDLAAGLNTAGFISGYRGSPLGTYDMALWQAQPFLDEHHIRFEPGVNEDLAATAVWGSQQASLHERPRYDGVFGIWYGKGPGVDRSTDALKHGNYAGSSTHGGVLVLAGDDPAARSSSIAHPERAGAHSLRDADPEPVASPGLPGSRPVRLRALALLRLLGRLQVHDRYGRQLSLRCGRPGARADRAARTRRSTGDGAGDRLGKPAAGSGAAPVRGAAGGGARLRARGASRPGSKRFWSSRRSGLSSRSSSLPCSTTWRIDRACSGSAMQRATRSSHWWASSARPTWCGLSTPGWDTTTPSALPV